MRHLQPYSMNARSLSAALLLLIAAVIGPHGLARAQQNAAQPATTPAMAEVLKKIETLDAATAPAVSNPASSVLAPAPGAPMPASDGLKSAQTPAAPPVTSAPVTVPAMQAVPPVTPPAVPPASDNLFFDAEALAPKGKAGTPAEGAQRAIRRVDPVTEPASKFIIVKKDYPPNSKQAVLISAQRAMTLGLYDSALQLYEQLYAKDRKNPDVLLGRATALQYLGRDEDAMRAYEELIDLKPSNIEAQVNMLGLVGKRFPAVALERLKTLYEKNPANVMIPGQIAVMNGALGYYAEAIKYLGIAASLEPKNPTHYFNMAVIAEKSGQASEAVKYYEQALELDSVNGGSGLPRDVIFDRLARLR